MQIQPALPALIALPVLPALPCLTCLSCLPPLALHILPALPALTALPVLPALPFLPDLPYQFRLIHYEQNRQRLPLHTAIQFAWQLNFVSMYISRSTLVFLYYYIITF